MTDHNDVLLKKFFAEQKQVVADEGFSHDVIRKLPSKASRYSRLWSSICIVAALILFVTCHGFKLIVTSLSVILKTAPTHSIFDYSPFTIIIAVVVLCGVGLYTLVTTDR